MGKSVEVSTVDLAGSSAAQIGYADASRRTETILAEVLADVVRAEQVSVDSHFFDDLGADSLVMARFCARVRKHTDVPSVSMKDIYRHSTIRSLAASLENAAPAQVEASAAASVSAPIEVTQPASTRQYLLCGTLQFLIFAGYSYLTALISSSGYDWISTSSDPIDIYPRLVLLGSAVFLAMCALPILAKWILIGRWRPQQIQIWSLAYVRFWTVKTLIRSNPLVLFIGSPLYVLYLRTLGAKIGPGVAIFSRNVPVCTDLLTIGAGSVIRKDSFFQCYRAHAGLIQTGSVTLGKNVSVGEATVIDIETTIGDGARLGRSSSLHTGQAVPAGEHWHGSPAQRTAGGGYHPVEPAVRGALTRVTYSVLQPLSLLLIYLPLVIGCMGLLSDEIPQLAAVLDAGPQAFTTWTFYRDALAASAILFFGAVLIGLVFVAIVPRVLYLTLRPGKAYPLYGFHYNMQRSITRMTNIKFFVSLFGDSSYIVHYLRFLGYDVTLAEQTGSNFGTAVKHDIPYLCSVGQGTMVADGLSIINTEFSSTSFRLSRTSIGPRNFLGNHIAYPSQGRTGDNCLLGTKVLVPVDGEIRENTGLLGSPNIEIPRMVQRDSNFDGLRSESERRYRLPAKNKHNVITMWWFLLVRWLHFFGVTLIAAGAANLYESLGASAIALDSVLTLLFTVVYYTLVERVVMVVLPLRPLLCSIYDPRFWRHERFWKVPQVNYLTVFNGTPFKNAIWRLIGVRLGKRVFDDGCYLSERTLTTIGDDCVLNAGSKIQCHSQEDGGFKSDHTVIGAGCTIGVGALVHYGVTMGDGAVLGPDSFLMKGEEVPPHARWEGNPARFRHQSDFSDRP